MGRDREVREIFAAMLSRKHILLEGPPGTSKSTIVRSIARSMHVPFHFIEGSIDLTPSKLLGFFNPGKVLKDSYLREYFEMGPLTLAMEEGGVLYLEEFNRMSAESANLLITPMEERVINIPRYGQVTAKDGFTIICSQNPYDDVGTLQVSRAFLDRVVRVRMDYQSEDEEIDIVKLRSGSSEEALDTHGGARHPRHPRHARDQAGRLGAGGHRHRDRGREPALPQRRRPALRGPGRRLQDGLDQQGVAERDDQRRSRGDHRQGDRAGA